MASKKMKYASMVGIGLMTMSLMACANEESQYQTLGDSDLKTPDQTFTGGTEENKCREYELQDDGSYKCDNDGDSSGGGSSLVMLPFFFNGQSYSSHSAMVASSDYKKNNLVSGTKYKSSNSKDSNKSKSNTQVKTNKSGAGSNNAKSGSTKSGGFGRGGGGSSNGG